MRQQVGLETLSPHELHLSEQKLQFSKVEYKVMPINSSFSLRSPERMILSDRDGDTSVITMPFNIILAVFVTDTCHI